MRVDDKDPGAGRIEERLLGRRAAVRVHRSMALAEGLIEEISRRTVPLLIPSCDCPGSTTRMVRNAEVNLEPSILPLAVHKRASRKLAGLVTTSLSASRHADSDPRGCSHTSVDYCG